MNIFFLDKDPVVAARYHHDVHLNKMILETAQLLSTAHHILESDQNILNMIYKQTHKNHPSAVWVRDTCGNYRWTYTLFVSLLDEYVFRKSIKHKTSQLSSLLDTPPARLGNKKNALSVDMQLTLPPMCMPDEYKTSGFCFDAVVEAYRNYYKGAKQHDKNGKFIGNYTKRKPPEWLIERNGVLG